MGIQNSTTRKTVACLRCGVIRTVDKRAKGSMCRKCVGATNSIKFRGHKVTPETRAKLSRAHKGRKLSPERAEKLRQSLIGRVLSETTKRKISASHKARLAFPFKIRMVVYRIYFPRRVARYWLGKKRSPETNAKIRQTKLAKGDGVGERNPAWNGGVSRVGYPYVFNAKLKLQIRQRDGFVCVLCGRTEFAEKKEFGRVLCVNHIDFDKKNCDPSNLNTLCLRCNTHVNAARPYWTRYFQEQLLNVA